MVKAVSLTLLLLVGVAMIDVSRACFGTLSTEDSSVYDYVGDEETTAAAEEDTTDCDCDIPDEEVGPDCKSKLLKGIIDESMEANGDDAGAISDQIQASAAELFGGDFEVICAPSDFAYRNWYSKGKMCKSTGDSFTCLAWRD